jgi:plasmid maintenance system antidote protein VapI
MSYYIQIPEHFYKYILARIERRYYSNVRISQESGICENTITQLVNGYAMQITPKTWQKLRKYFKIKEESITDIDLSKYKD